MPEPPRQSPSTPPDAGSGHEPDDSGLALPAQIAGSGALDRLVETARA